MSKNPPKYAIKPVAHNKQRRAKWHNYSLPGLYMLTLVIEDRHPLFGTLKAQPSPHVELSTLGMALLTDELPKITGCYPMAKVWKVAIMPDHLHLILHITDNLPKGVGLGRIVSGFKYGCTQAYRKLGGSGQLFEDGYHDRILLNGMDAERWKLYLDDNPRRAVIKRDNPEFFTVMRSVTIAGHPCQAVGNHHLLSVPDKMAVVVHRADSDDDYARLCSQWMACAEQGGVLVSAAIAERERWVIKAAFERGHRIILLRKNGFPPLYKPSGRAFDACSQGLLLQISPWPYQPEKRTISRQQCLFLNSIAEALCKAPN